EHQAIALARIKPQATAYHLRVEPLALRRAQEHHRIGARRVEALAQNVDVADRTQLAVDEPLDDAVAFGLGRLAGDLRRVDAVLAQLGANVSAMFDINAEKDDALPALGIKDR